MDPVLEDQTDRNDLWIGLTLKSVHELRPHTGIEEAAFRHGPWLNQTKGFVLYGILDEAEKAALFLMRIKDAVKSTREDLRSHPAWRTSLSVLMEEQQLRVRRLCESFVTAVLFGTTDEDEYYRYYVQLTEVVYYASHRGDLAEFYGRPSAWLDARCIGSLGAIFEPQR